MGVVVVCGVVRRVRRATVLLCVRACARFFSLFACVLVLVLAACVWPMTCICYMPFAIWRAWPACASHCRPEPRFDADLTLFDAEVDAVLTQAL